jgi:hypothetical protein
MRWWWMRVTNTVRWWWCNLTGGHVWAALMQYDMPRVGDYRTYGCSTMCRRCRLVLHNRVTVSEVMLATALVGDTDIVAYQKQRMVREMFAATAGRAVPVVDTFEAWMEEYRGYKYRGYR